MRRHCQPSAYVIQQTNPTTFPSCSLFLLLPLDSSFLTPLSHSPSILHSFFTLSLFSLSIPLLLGGVFFATSFLHLLPEAKEEMRKFFDLATITFQFPACEFIVSLGFFLVLFAEQLTSRLHRIFVARKKTKSLQSNQTPIFTAEIPTNVTTEDRNDEKNKNKFEYKADYQNVESLAVENKTNTSECEDPDNQISSIVLCNDATCTEYNHSSMRLSLSPLFLPPLSLPRSLPLFLFLFLSFCLSHNVKVCINTFIARSVVPSKQDAHPSTRRFHFLVLY
ncbi:SLC39A1_2_3 [Acanthosepion pharaonis]|uniref:SLC39A1_2_3 n=1 Tax=Acanthosepion pharaonis TaxID=158019 RepID=A0A812BJW5_ACAPH|nr:SLC39A1_2_3 [Sepia pharaonis]